MELWWNFKSLYLGGKLLGSLINGIDKTLLSRTKHNKTKVILKFNQILNFSV